MENLEAMSNEKQMRKTKCLVQGKEKSSGIVIQII